MSSEEEESYPYASSTERAETPRKSSFVDPPYSEHDQSKVKEPETWCRLRFNKSYYQNLPRRRATDHQNKVDIQDVE